MTASKLCSIGAQGTLLGAGGQEQVLPDDHFLRKIPGGWSPRQLSEQICKKHTFLEETPILLSLKSKAHHPGRVDRCRQMLCVVTADCVTTVKLRPHTVLSWVLSNIRKKNTLNSLTTHLPMKTLNMLIEDLPIFSRYLYIYFK